MSLLDALHSNVIAITGSTVKDTSAWWEARPHEGNVIPPGCHRQENVKPQPPTPLSDAVAWGAEATPKLTAWSTLCLYIGAGPGVKLPVVRNRR